MIKRFNEFVNEHGVGFNKDGEPYGFDGSDRDRNRTWGYFDDEYKSESDFLSQTITKEFGKENSYSGSADWGGISVWTVKGTKFEGVFIGIDDNDEVFLLKRKSNKPEDNDAYTDDTIATATNPKELAELIKKAKSLKS